MLTNIFLELVGQVCLQPSEGYLRRDHTNPVAHSGFNFVEERLTRIDKLGEGRLVQ